MQGSVSPIGQAGKPGLSTPPTEKALTALRNKFAEAERRLMIPEDVLTAKARLIFNEPGTPQQKRNRIKEETREMIETAQQLLKDCCDTQLNPYRELASPTKQQTRFIQTLESQSHVYHNALETRSTAIESALQAKFNALGTPKTASSRWLASFWNAFGPHQS